MSSYKNFTNTQFYYYAWKIQMPQQSEDEEREQRIHMEIIVDSNGH